MTKNTETTRRALYECLDRIRRAGKHRKLTLEFEGLLEEHLEALTPKLMMMFADELLAERNGLQARLHSIDTAYSKSQEALGVAGERIRELETKVAGYHSDAMTLRLERDRLVQHNKDLDAVVLNQRQAYAELYMENHRNNSRNNLS